MQRRDTTSLWVTPITEATDDPVVSLPEPIRFIAMHAVRGDGSIAPLGAVWLSEDATGGGFVPARVGGWLAEEMQRSYDGAIARGWTPGRIFEYWLDRATADDDLLVDRPDHSDDVDDLRRMLDA